MFDLSKIHIENIVKSPRSTFYGILIFLLSLVYLFAFDKGSLSEVWPVWIFVAWLLFAEDTKTKPPAAALIVLLSLTLTSCGLWTPQKRLNHLINKHPYLITNVIDTIRFDTTILQFKPKEAFSLPVNIAAPKFIYGKNYTLEYYKPANIDTVYLTVTAKPDTVYITKKIPYKAQQITAEPQCEFIKILKFIIAILIILLIIYVVTKII